MVALVGLKVVALVYGPKAILWVQQNWGWLFTLEQLLSESLTNSLVNINDMY